MKLLFKLLITLLVIVIGIISDMIGTASLTSNEATFHAKSSKKIKGSIALFCGLVFIVIGLKFIGVPLQIYGVYEFFKAYAIKFLSYFEFIPVIGPYITRMRQSASLKKNDDANKV